MNNEGVSEIIGTILLVGITVTIAAVFGLVILNQDGPGEHQYSQVSYSLHTGPDGLWDTGDEFVQIRHVGGEPFESSDTRILLMFESDTIEVTGAALTGGFSDGTFSIGETWTYTVQAAADETLEVRTIVPRQLHSTWINGVSPGGVVANPCDTDTTDPVIGAISISPANIDTATTGSITVSVSITEPCGLQSVELTYDTGSGPTTIQMTQSGGWQATIPDQGWSGLGGQVLALTVTAVDTTGNSASANFNEAINQVGATQPFTDTNCNGVFDAGDSLIDESEFADGEYKENECVVFPAGWGAQSREEWDIDADSLTIEVDLTATDGEIDLHIDDLLDVSNVVLTATDRIHFKSQAIIAIGATITGDQIQFDPDGSGSTMDLAGATIEATDDHVDIQNTQGYLHAAGASFTSSEDKDILLRSATDLLLQDTTLNSGDDIILRATTTINVENADHTADDDFAIVTQNGQTLLVQNFCGIDSDYQLASTGTPSGTTRLLCGVLV